MEAGRAAGGANLQFLAELGHALGRRAMLEAAQRAWLVRYQSEDPADGREAARQLIKTENRSGWTDGAWANYLLVRVAEEAQAARALGHRAWADAYLLEAASMRAPKHDHEFWAAAAGSMLAALALCPEPEARRFELIQRGMLDVNEIDSGLSWNDTPYDTHVYSQDTAAAVEGRVMHDRRARPGSATFNGLAFLASRQAQSGGWGDTLSLLDDVAARGNDELAPADAADGETPECNAQIVRALAVAVMRTPRG